MSDENCDRGNVDLRQFEDLPFCSQVDPTYPEVPPEIVDSPFNVPLPTYSCNCINVSMGATAKWTPKRKFKAGGYFEAVGDCCDGNYEGGIGLEIPCPAVKKGTGEKVRVSIKYGDGANSLAKEVLSIDSKQCTVSPKLARFDLNIKCPVLGFDGKHKLHARARYAQSFNSPSASFITTNRKTCAIEPLDPVLNLDIKCPVQGTSSGGAIRAKIGYGSGFNSASARLIDADSKQCVIRAASPTLDLSIPCPLVAAGEKSCTVSPSSGLEIRRSGIPLKSYCISPNRTFNRWDILDQTTVIAYFTSAGLGDWNLAYKEPDVSFVRDGKEITRDIIYGECSPNEGHEQCFGEDVILFGPGEVGFITRFFDPKSSSSSPPPPPYSIVKINDMDGSACTLEPLGGPVGVLNIPCPVRKKDKSENPKLKIGLEYGEDFNSPSASVVSIGSSCDVTWPEITEMRLSIPCPLNNLNIVAENIAATESTPIGLYLESTEDSGDSGACTKGIKFKFAWPKPWPDWESDSSFNLDGVFASMLPCIDIVVGVRWNHDGGHRLEMGKVPLCNPTAEVVWEDILIAQAHTGEC